MSDMKFCQGPECHMHKTKDRIKGMKGSKTYQTRRRSSFYYGNDNFCSLNCQNDWFNKYGDRAIDHFGRTTEVKHLTEQNAWQKTYDWSGGYDDDHRVYVYRNGITNEQRPLTEEQYRDTNYTLNTGE
jgi:hypothetical protein